MHAIYLFNEICVPRGSTGGRVSFCWSRVCARPEYINPVVANGKKNYIAPVKIIMYGRYKKKKHEMNGEKRRRKVRKKLLHDSCRCLISYERARSQLLCVAGLLSSDQTTVVHIKTYIILLKKTTY